MRALTAINLATILAVCGCDGKILEPDQQIDAFEAEADGREALRVLRRLAEQHGLKLEGGLYLQPMKAAAPPVDEAKIRAGDCLLVARRGASVIEFSLTNRDRMSCPAEIHAIFDQARRQLAPN